MTKIKKEEFFSLKKENRDLRAILESMNILLVHTQEGIRWFNRDAPGPYLMLG